MKPDFRHAYHEHMHHVSGQLKRARGEVRLASRTVNASALTPSQIDDVAMRDAEFVVNIAVHQWNEEVERRARR